MEQEARNVVKGVLERERERLCLSGDATVVSCDPVFLLLFSLQGTSHILAHREPDSKLWSHLKILKPPLNQRDEFVEDYTEPNTKGSGPIQSKDIQSVLVASHLSS